MFYANAFSVSLFRWLDKRHQRSGLSADSRLTQAAGTNSQLLYFGKGFSNICRSLSLSLSIYHTLVSLPPLFSLAFQMSSPNQSLYSTYQQSVFYCSLTVALVCFYLLNGLCRGPHFRFKTPSHLHKVDQAGQNICSHPNRLETGCRRTIEESELSLRSLLHYLI